MFKFLLRKLKKITRATRVNFDNKYTRKLDFYILRLCLKHKAIEIKFATKDVVKENRDLVDVFLSEVIGHPEAWVSDSSSISDFSNVFKKPTLKEKEKIIKRTKEVFGVNIRPVYDKNFGELFTFIKEKQRGRKPIYNKG